MRWLCLKHLPQGLFGLQHKYIFSRAAYLLYIFSELCYNKPCSWGISSAGRVPHWQCGCQRFESAMLHHKVINPAFAGFFAIYIEIIPNNTDAENKDNRTVWRCLLNTRLNFGDWYAVSQRFFNQNSNLEHPIR